MKLTGVMLHEDVITINILSGFDYCNIISIFAIFHFKNCHFENISSKIQRNGPGLLVVSDHHYYFQEQRYSILHFIILDCTFINIRTGVSLKISLLVGIVVRTSTLLIHINSSSFAVIQVTETVTWISSPILMLHGPTKILSQFSIVNVVNGPLILMGRIITISGIHVYRD